MSVTILFNRAKNNLPIVNQSESSECGLACLAMVSAYYGYHISLPILRRRFSTSLRGMTFKSIVEAASKVNLQARALQVPFEIIEQVKTPAVLHWNLNHFVVLKSVSRKKIVIHDPASGKCVLTHEEFSKSYTGLVLELTPDEKFERRKETLNLKIYDLWGKLSGLKKGLLQLLLMSLFLQFIVLLNPLFLQIVVDEVIGKSNSNLLLTLAVGFAGLSIINACTQLIRGLIVVYLGSTITFQIASNLFKHLLGLPLDYFEKRHIGDISSRFQSIAPIKQLLTEGIVTSLIDGVMVITTVIMMYIYSPLLASISLITWVAYLIMRLLFFPLLKNREEIAIKSQAMADSVFMESARSITILKLFSAQASRLSIWQNHYADEINSNAASQRFKLWFQATSSALSGLELVLIVYIAGNLALSGQFTVGMIFAFLAFRNNFASKASNLVDQVIELRMLGLHLSRISDIVYSQIEAIPLSSQLNSNELTGNIKLKNVSYRYSSDGPRILDNVSLSIRAGESVAIVGTTGCGKSTLLKLMAGLFTPEEGEVKVDDVTLSSENYEDYRRQVSVVMQDDVLLSGTIAENISFFASRWDEEQLINAAKMASVYKDIVAMPMKFDTQIGDMGSTLSGGQKQRIALARAFYREHKILFIDEGTSHLDLETESNIITELSNLGVTRIFIAHRPETIRSADRIFSLEHGKLAELEDWQPYDANASATSSLNEPRLINSTYRKEC